MSLASRGAVSAPRPGTAPVLLLTHASDTFTIDRVQRALATRGVDALRVDTDTFPGALVASLRVQRGATRSTLQLGARTVRLERVPAVWCRRLWPGAVPGPQAELSGLFAATALRQVLTVGASAARWLNPLEAQERAESKALQLSLAHRCGLSLAPTLLTNSPSAALAFAGPDSVIKALVQPVVSLQPHPAFVYTQRFTPARAPALRAFPQLVQRRVPRRGEVRLVVVGRRQLAAQLEREDDAGSSPIDWRPVRAGERRAWRPIEPPAQVRTGCAAMLRELGLSFGAFDFIVTPKGKWVFLEVNPAGEWGWLERDAGLPISRAIAAWLAP